ncbi:hypothetical protein JX266_000317 [Neoarthrinium moseri]|nr:hypothetical protein JX266_000317 [Neoarthrinium moseri]
MQSSDMALGNWMNNTRKKRRPALACSSCRRRKIRCDRQTPCEQCIKANIETCSYVTSSRASPNSAPFHPQDTQFYVFEQAPSQSRMETNFTTSSNWMPEVPSDASSTLSSHHGHSLSIGASLPAEQVQVPAASGPFSQSPLENWFPAIKRATRGSFSRTRFYGQSHWLNFVHQAVITAHEANESNRCTIARCRSLSDVIATQEAVRSQTAFDSYRDLIPDRAVADVLIQAYLRTFQRVFGILSVATFLDNYKAFQANPDAVGDTFAVPLALVLCLGSSFCSQEAGIARNTVLGWVGFASSRIYSSIDTKELNLDVIRTHCLFFLTRQVFCVDESNHWLPAGSLMRLAIHLSLHIDPVKHDFQDMPPSEIEARRRLWATVLELEVQSSMDHGERPSIGVEDYDCAPPLNIDDADLNTSTPLPKAEDELTQTSVQILLMRSIPTRLKIARLLNNFQGDLSFEAVLSLSSELSETLKCCTRLLEAFRMSTNSPTAFQTKMYDLMVQRFVLGLHHPFALKAMENPSYYYSRKMCVGASLRLLTHNSALSGDEDFQRIRMRGSGLFMIPFTQCALYLCSELTDQAETEEPVPTNGQETSLYKQLHSGTKSYLNCVKERSQLSERDLGCYLSVCCLLAQADAMKSNTSVEPKISQALANGLNAYHESLLSRLQESKELTSWEMYDELSNGDGANNNQEWPAWDEPTVNLNLDPSWGPAVLTPPSGRWQSQGLLTKFGT